MTVDKLISVLSCISPQLSVRPWGRLVWGPKVLKHLCDEPILGMRRAAATPFIEICDQVPLRIIPMFSAIASNKKKAFFKRHFLTTRFFVFCCALMIGSQQPRGKS
jgi:hypothetical protein